MMSVLVILALFAGVAPFLYRAIGVRAASFLALAPALAFAYFASLAPRIRSGSSLSIEWSWIPCLDFAFSLRMDGLALLFALLITGIGAFVVLYAGFYLREDPAAPRFLSALFVFMASMLGVVLADSVIALFVFWELTSFTSYLLIGHHHEDEKSRKAALQALLVTGLGGLFLLAGLILLAQAAGSTNLSGILAAQGLPEHPHAEAALWLILIGAFTKSAQFPFHFWLPNAMAAPTPASAYLHSSTMVKAGVYLLARLHPALSATETWTTVVPIVGAATLAAGALLAIGQTYLKRLLAYTTVGALGSMTMLLGFGAATAAKAAACVLLAHALYKASLFLVAGIIDHETGEKNVERLGGLRREMRWTALGALLSALSMIGLPPFFGFIAKETLYGATTPILWSTIAVLASASFVGVAYLTGIKPFWGRAPTTPLHAHEAPAGMWVGPLLLGMIGLLFGVVPNMAASWLIGPAASAIVGDAIHAKLVLWHGFNRELLLSAVTLGLGVFSIIVLPLARKTASALRPFAKIGPERGYEIALKGMLRIAEAQTRALQNGSLHNYLWMTLAFVLLTTGWYFWRYVPFPLLLGLTPVKLIDAVILALIIFSTFGAIFSRSRMAAFASLGVAGYSIAIFFVLYSAPDLAMTQLVVETLTVILLVLAFYHLPPFRARTSAPVRVLDILPAALVGLVAAGLTLSANLAQFAPRISDFFAGNSWTNAYGKNIVNVILVDFRALDTLGEITVLAIAGLGAVALLKLRPGKKGGEP